MSANLAESDFPDSSDQAADNLRKPLFTYRASASCLGSIWRLKGWRLEEEPFPLDSIEEAVVMNLVQPSAVTSNA
jgi:hypothetical protein